MQESQNIRIKKPKTQTWNFPVLINCIVLGKKGTCLNSCGTHTFKQKIEEKRHRAICI